RRAGGDGGAGGPRAGSRGALLSDQPRGRLRRAPARRARRGRRADPEPRRVDALLLGDPRCARDRLAAGCRGPPLRPHPARLLASGLGARGAVLRGRAGPRPGRISRRARAFVRAPARRSGMSEGIPARLERISEPVGERGLDALLVEEAADLRYVSGYTGTNGLALLRPPGGGAPKFLTDFRYTTQSAAEVDPAYERATVTGELRDSLPSLLGDGGGRLGFDSTKLTVRGHIRLGELLGPAWELVAADGLIGEQRAVKEAAEVAALGASAQLADEALRRVLEGGLAGRTESQVALALEMAMRELGAEQPSFPSIVAAGAHGALPHAQPRDVEIPRDVLVTIDWGAIHEGYCSDCTRTFATGESVSERAREVYELVRAAQLAGLEALRAGPNGREVDGAARAVIDAGGEGA